MRFKTKFMRLIARYAKDNGLYQEFLIKVKRTINSYKITTEQELISSLKTPQRMIYTLAPNINPFVDYSHNDCMMYFYKEKEFEAIKKLFENFLKEHNILNDFKRNIDIRFILNYGREDLSNIDVCAIKCIEDKYTVLLNNISPYAFIDEAFSWELSPQGHSFWGNVDVLWCKVLDKYIDEKYIGEDIKLEPQSITHTINTNSYSLSYTIT